MYGKTTLNEIASSAEALKTARSEPIQQEAAPRRSMDFIRSLILDLPIQTLVETPEPVVEEIKVVEDESISEILRLAGMSKNKV